MIPQDNIYPIDEERRPRKHNEYLVAINNSFKISHGKTTIHKWKLYPICDGSVIDERGNPRPIHLHPTVEFSVSIP